MTREEREDAINCFKNKLENEVFGAKYNKLALEALEQEPRWIPMVSRKPTEEEKAEYLEQNGEELCYMMENEMPLDGQEVLVSVGGRVSEDVFDEDFYNFENNDIENVDAWMPLPESYKGES